MFNSDDARIPSHIWIEAEIRRLSSLGLGVYVAVRGDKMGGLVLQKISNMAGQCRLLIQQRAMHGRMTWADALDAAEVSELDADAYIKRAVARDPDLWVVEIEDRSMSQRMEF